MCAHILAQSAPERIVAVRRDQRVAAVPDFGQSVVGVVHVVAAIGRIGAVCLADGVAVGVVAVADCAGLGELVVFVIGPDGGSGLAVGDYAGSQEGQAEKLQYDIFYLIHHSILLDLFILLKTVQTVIWGKGN